MSLDNVFKTNESARKSSKLIKYSAKQVYDAQSVLAGSTQCTFKQAPARYQPPRRRVRCSKGAKISGGDFVPLELNGPSLWLQERSVLFGRAFQSMEIARNSITSATKVSTETVLNYW